MIAAARYQPTETELLAHSRHMAFRASIAEKAAALQAPRAPVVPAPLALPAMKTPWFRILSVEKLPPKISEIQTMVCAVYGLTLNQLLADRRTKDIVLPRQIAIYLCKELTAHSLPQIGRKFGGKDHTTILHAVRRIRSQIESDSKLADIVSSLRADLEALD